MRSMDEPTSIAGKIIMLHDSGYTPSQIALQLKVPRARVNATIRQASSRSMDSRRLFECWEMLTEALALLRQLTDKPVIAKRMADIEKRDLPLKLGAAIDRLT